MLPAQVRQTKHWRNNAVSSLCLLDVGPNYSAVLPSLVIMPFGNTDASIYTHGSL